HADHVARELREHRGLIARSRTDFEDVVVGAWIEKLGHAGHHEWLRDGLSLGDGQGMVAVRHGTVALEHELLARHTGHRVQHARIAYPQPPELPDHLLARDHHAHMMARSRRSSLLDGYADQASPLGPGAVVVADLVMAEQVAQHEPGVGAPLADAAVRDDLTASGQALSLVDRPKLVGVLEASVFGDGRGPRNVLRAGDVTTALRALLWKILRREQLARVLLRGADVDDLRATIRHALEHQVPQ